MLPFLISSTVPHRVLSPRRFTEPCSCAMTVFSTASRIFLGCALLVKRVAREMTSLRASNSALMSSAALMSCANLEGLITAGSH